MRIITAVFNYPGQDKYERCLRALTSSIKTNAPNADFHVIRLEAPDPIGGIFQGFINNHVKLEAYAECEIDVPTVFIDADMVVLRDPFQLFDDTFDVAIGRRPVKQQSIFNGGVVLFQPNDIAREFMKQWAEIDGKMLLDKKFHQQYHCRYRGMNQSSFGYMYEEKPVPARIKEYPTAIINACEQDWQNVETLKPYIIHVRKKLLDAVQQPIPISNISRRMRDAARIWRHYAGEAEPQKTRPPSTMNPVKKRKNNYRQQKYRGRIKGEELRKRIADGN